MLFRNKDNGKDLYVFGMHGTIIGTIRNVSSMALRKCSTVTEKRGSGKRAARRRAMVSGSVPHYQAKAVDHTGDSKTNKTERLPLA